MSSLFPEDDPPLTGRVQDDCPGRVHLGFRGRSGKTARTVARDEREQSLAARSKKLCGWARTHDWTLRCSFSSLCCPPAAWLATKTLARAGMGGPEILSQDELPVGTTIRVVKVLACTNCIFGDGDELEVELPTLTKYALHRTTIRFTFGGKDILLKEGGKASLNSALFDRVQG
jgi:hypothetical protein